MEYTVTVGCLPEDLPIKGNAIATGDSEEDERIEEAIRSELEYNEWAWCCAQVTVTLDSPCSACGQSLSETEYLGCCSYQDEQDFIEGLYYSDMVQTCLDRLQERLDDCGQLKKSC